MELARLAAGTRRREESERARRGAADPDILVTRASSSLGGVQETSYRVGGGWGGEVQVCEVCGEEFCHGGCVTSDYSHQERRGEVQAGRQGAGKRSKARRKKGGSKTAVK